jgi:hypothetical protein
MTGSNMTATRQRPTGLYPPAQTQQMHTLIAGLQPVNRVLPRHLSIAEEQTLRKRAQQLSAWSDPAKPNEIKGAISRCFIGLGGEKLSTEQAEMMMAQYVTVLSGMKLWAIERACLRFAAGEVKAEDVGAKHLEPAMRPSSAHLRIMAAIISESFDKERAEIDKVLTAHPPKHEPTEEERAAGLAKTRAWQELRSGADAKKAPVPGHASRTMDDINKRHHDRIIQEYIAAGLPAPTAAIPTSLPMLLEMGWSIVEKRGEKILVKPDHPTPIRRSLGR